MWTFNYFVPRLDIKEEKASADNVIDCISHNFADPTDDAASHEIPERLNFRGSLVAL
jgi:hypothetical protein